MVTARCFPGCHVSNVHGSYSAWAVSRLSKIPVFTPDRAAPQSLAAAGGGLFEEVIEPKHGHWNGP